MAINFSFLTSSPGTTENGIVARDITENMLSHQSRKTTFLTAILNESPIQYKTTPDNYEIYGSKDQKRKFTVASWNAGTLKMTITGTTASQVILPDDFLMAIENTDGSTVTLNVERQVKSVAESGGNSIIEIQSVFGGGDLTAGDVIYVNSQGVGEKSKARDAVTVQPLRDTNSVTFMRDTLEVSTIANKTDTVYDVIKLNRALVGNNLKVDAEAKMLMGTGQTSLTGYNSGGQVFNTKGFLKALIDDDIESTLVDSETGIEAGRQYFDFGDSVTFNDFSVLCLKLRKGSPVKYMFVDSLFMHSAANFVFDKSHITSTFKILDVEFTEVKINGVTLRITELEYLNRIGYKGGFVVDFGSCRATGFQDFKTVTPADENSEGKKAKEQPMLFGWTAVIRADNQWVEDEEVIGCIGIEFFDAEYHALIQHSISIA